MSDDLLKRLSEKPFERWALDRIEALEAALRAIANPDNCLMLSEVEEIARAALDKDTEQ